MQATPIISVIVPCYNQGKYLDEALQSIFDQTHAGWECLIIDDGSTDNTEQVARKWTNKDVRFKYFYKENGGLSSARNKGLDECTGDYIQFLDADDFIEPEKFSESLKTGQQSDIVITNFKMFTHKSKPYTEASFSLNNEQFNFQNILMKWDDGFAIPIHCGLFKRKLFATIRFNEQLKAKEDWVMWLQIYQLDIATLFIDKSYAMYRFTAGSMTQNKLHMSSNLVLAYHYIYTFLPVKYRDMFFKKAVDALGGLLAESETILVNTRLSASYRLGNFLIRPFTRLRVRKQ